MKNLLLIYEDCKLQKIPELKNFQIKIIKRKKRIDLMNFGEKGNYIATEYNRILFSTDSEFIFFICSSELNSETEKMISEFKLKKDFDLFKNSGNKTLEFLSGFVVKRDILLKIGFFDKHVFYNLYTNFLVNYCRFSEHFEMNKINFEPFLNMNLNNFFRLFFWSFFEDTYYSDRILYLSCFNSLNYKIKFLLGDYGRFYNFAELSIFVIMIPLLPLINKFVKKSTAIRY